MWRDEHRLQTRCRDSPRGLITGGLAFFGAVVVIVGTIAPVIALSVPPDGATTGPNQTTGTDTAADVVGGATSGVTGSLSVTAENASGDVVRGASVVLYDADWTRIGTKQTDASGTVAWNALDNGTYHVELYGPSGSYWATETDVTVRDGATTTTVRRRAPRVRTVSVRGTEFVGGNYSMADPITVQPTVRNDGPERAVRVTVELDTDGDGTAEMNGTSGNASTMVGTGERLGLDVTLDPATAGVHRVRVVTETRIADNWTVTDSTDWQWSVRVEHTIVGYHPHTGEFSNTTTTGGQSPGALAEATLPAGTSLGDVAPIDTNYKRLNVTDGATYPWSAVGHVRTTIGVFLTSCSGVLLDDNHVLTAAHCVYNQTATDWPSRVQFAPGRDNETFPFGNVSVSFVQLYKQYVHTGNRTYDIAVLTLSDPIGSQTGTFGFATHPPDSPVYDNPAHITGYPARGAEPYVNRSRELWDLIGNESILADQLNLDSTSDCRGTTRCHFYDTGGPLVSLTATGLSGAPVWNLTDDGLPSVMSVHVAGPGGIVADVVSNGVGVRIDDEKYSELGELLRRGDAINHPPMATLEVDRAETTAGETVTLDASASNDANGDQIQYDWRVVKQPSNASVSLPDGASGDVTIPEPGLYQFRVNVTDPSGKSDTDSVIVFAQESTTDSGNLTVRVRQVRRPDFPNVTVYASVRGQNGTLLSGLGTEDFSIAENATDQSIRSVDAVRSAGGANVSVALVLDRSSSMAGTKLRDARTAASQFVSQFGPDDEGLVLAFNERIEFRQRWTRDAARLERAIGGISSGGNTALWRATIEAVNETASRLGRSAVVVLTDGKNNRPPDDVQRVIDRATAAGVPVYTIGLGSNVDAASLERLANETGGTYYESPESDDLAAIYDRISQTITAEYEITYHTTNEATDGTNRTVELTATTAGDSGTDTGVYQAPCAPLPDAAFGFSPDSPDTTQQITFDGSASRPNGGAIVAYRWDFDNDGVVDAVGPNATHTYARNGTYEVRLTVEKDCGASDVTVKSLTVAAAGDTPDTAVVDGFEDGDIAEYDTLAGPRSAWASNTSDAPAGQVALQYTGGDEPAEIASLDGLPRYPEQGDVLRFEFGTFGDWDFRTSFNFGQQPNSSFNDRFELELEPHTDTVRLQIDRNGTDTTLGNATVDFERDSFYTVEIDWAGTSPVIQVRLFENPPKNGSDPVGTLRAPIPADAPTRGGIGVFANGEGDRWIYDDVRLVDPSDVESGSSLFEIVATEEGEIEYEIVVNGSAEKAVVSEKIKAEGNDAIRRVDANTTVIEGYTGNTGYGDAYWFDGDIVDFTRIAGDVDVFVRIDGTRIPIADL